MMGWILFNLSLACPGDECYHLPIEEDPPARVIVLSGTYSYESQGKQIRPGDWTVAN